MPPAAEVASKSWIATLVPSGSPSLPSTAIVTGVPAKVPAASAAATGSSGLGGHGHRHRLHEARALGVLDGEAEAVGAEEVRVRQVGDGLVGVDDRRAVAWVARRGQREAALAGEHVERRRCRPRRRWPRPRDRRRRSIGVSGAVAATARPCLDDLEEVDVQPDRAAGEGDGVEALAQHHLGGRVGVLLLGGGEDPGIAPGGAGALELQEAARGGGDRDGALGQERPGVAVDPHPDVVARVARVVGVAGGAHPEVVEPGLLDVDRGAEQPLGRASSPSRRGSRS